MEQHHFSVVSFDGSRKNVIKEFDHILDDDELFDELGKLFEKDTEHITLLKVVTA